MHSILWLPLLPKTLSFPVLFTRMVITSHLNILKSYLAFKDGSEAIISPTVPQLCNSLFSKLILLYLHLFVTGIPC